MRRWPRGSLTPARRTAAADPLPIGTRYFALLCLHLQRLGEGRGEALGRGLGEVKRI
jgi:hypothetical protein